MNCPRCGRLACGCTVVTTGTTIATANIPYVAPAPQSCTGAEFVEAAQKAITPRTDEEIREIISSIEGEQPLPSPATPDAPVCGDGEPTFEMDEVTVCLRVALLTSAGPPKPKPDVVYAYALAHAREVLRLHAQGNTLRASNAALTTEVEGLRERLGEAEHARERLSVALESSSETIVQQDERRIALLRLDTPWPLVDVVRTLVDASKHLLQDHGCDLHGHERTKFAIAEALEWLRGLSTAGAEAK